MKRERKERRRGDFSESGLPDLITDDGTSLDKALQVWSETGDAERLRELESRLMNTDDPSEQQHIRRQIRELRDAIAERDIYPKLRTGSLIASGVPHPPGHYPRREPLSAELWYFDDDEPTFGGPDWDESEFWGEEGQLLFARVRIHDAGSAQAKTQADIRLPPIWFLVDETNKKVLLSVGAELTGSSYELVQALLPEFEAGKAAEHPHSGSRFVDVGELQEILDKDEVTVRKGVERLRRKMAKDVFETTGVEVPQDAFIQTGKTRGYRLSPEMIRVYSAPPLP